MLKIIKDNLLKLKLWQGKEKHYKAMTMFFFVIVVGGLFLGVHSVNAETFGLQTATNFFAHILLTVAEIFMRIGLWSLEYTKAIATYNNFMDAPPVVLGWLMVRDLANMFFVVILLVIAFGTILGLEQYEWKRSLIKLVLAAIFINFSKLILQLIIDASQVVTLTFFNAFADAAGENFINMFKLAEIKKMIVPEFIENQGAQSDSLSLQIFAASVMMVIMAGIAMVTMFAYLVILIARVVMLWILMVLSPLAFILQTIPSGQQYAKQFWDKFIHHVLVAPVMFFFLWLAFATLGNGNIAAQIGINVSQAAQAGEGFAAAADLKGVSSVSISEASTWENLSSFAMAIGFLLAGLTFVQGLGVVGGGLTQKATQFGMSVATIASGYAAGRWLVGKGVEAGKGVAKDYGKLAWGATGEKVLNLPYVRKVPIIGGAAGVGRKEAVKRLETLQQAREARYKAEGPTGLAARMAPTKKEIAGLEAGTAMMETTKEREKARLRAEATKDMFRNDHSEFANNKVAEFEARLGIKFENLDTLDPKNQGLLGQYKEYKEQIKKDPMQAVDAVQGLEEALSKDDRYKDKLTNQVKRDIDRKSSKGTFMIDRELEEQFAEEQVALEKNRKDEIGGFLKYGYEKSELKAYEKGLDDTKRDMTIQKHLGYSDKQMKEMSEEKKQKEWNKMDPEEAFKHQKSFSNAEVARAFVDSGRLEDLAKVGGAFGEYSSNRRLNKFKSQSETAKQAMADISRGMEGKSSDYLRRQEIRLAQEKFKEFDGYDVDRYFKEIGKGYEEISALHGKKKKGRLTENEEDELKSKMQNQAERVTAFEKEYPVLFANLAGAMHDSFKDEEITSVQNKSRVQAALISGKTFEEVGGYNPDENMRNDEKGIKNEEKDKRFRDTEEELHIAYKEKDGRLFRMKMIANNSKNLLASGGQVVEGLNEYGNTKLGYAPNMQAKLGKGKILGSGTEQGGEAVRKEYVTGNISPTNKNTADVRELLVQKGKGGRGSRYQNEQARKAVIMAISSGDGFGDQTNNRVILGGTFGKEGEAWDRKNGKFIMDKGSDIQRVAAEAYGAGLDAITSAKNTGTRDRLLSKMRERLEFAGVEKWVDDVSGKEITTVQANKEQIESFVRRKIIMETKPSTGSSTPPPPVPPAPGPKPVTPPPLPKQGQPKQTSETKASPNLNKVLTQVKNDLSNFSASLADIFANIPKMSSGVEDQIRKTAEKSGASSNAVQSAPVDYNLGKTIVEAINSKDESVRNDINAKIDTLKDNNKKNDMMNLLTKQGSLEQADIIKLGRVFRQAFESSSAGKGKPKT